MLFLSTRTSLPNRHSLRPVANLQHVYHASGHVEDPELVVGGAARWGPGRVFRMGPIE
jgi:hypothetical protein